MAKTRTFLDFDLAFTAHPTTGDLAVKADENAIKQAVKNLVLTQNYERPFHPEIGSQIYSLLFEPFSPLTQAMLQQAIINTVTNFEPRVILKEVNVLLNNDNQSAYVQIVFSIRNTQKPITVDITLKRTR